MASLLYNRTVQIQTFVGKAVS